MAWTTSLGGLYLNQLSGTVLRSSRFRCIPLPPFLLGACADLGVFETMVFGVFERPLIVSPP